MMSSKLILVLQGAPSCGCRWVPLGTFVLILQLAGSWEPLTMLNLHFVSGDHVCLGPMSLKTFGLFFIKRPKQITLISKRFHEKCQHICLLLHLTSRKTRCIDPLWIKILHYIPFCCSTKIRTMLNPSWGTTYGRTIATPIIHRQLASVRHMYILVWVNKNKKNLLFLVCPQLFLWGCLKKVK